jgi:hypothetical protein
MVQVDFFELALFSQKKKNHMKCAAGYEWAPCDIASRPHIGAFWISNSLAPGDSGGCSWCLISYSFFILFDAS